MAGEVAYQALVDIDLAIALGQHGFQCFELVHQLIETLARISALLAVKAAAKALLSTRICSSCFSAASPAWPHAVAQCFQQRRQTPDDFGTLFARDLGLADQIRSAAARFICRVASDWAPSRTAATAKTSAQT